MSELFEVMVCRLHALRGCTECFNANGPPCRHGLTIACPYCETVTLRARVAELEALVLQGGAVVKDFLPSIGSCALQDYGRLNSFLLAVEKEECAALAKAVPRG